MVSHPCYLDQRSDSPEQPIDRYWVGDKLYTVILETRDDGEGN
jgi:hypothetical protein